ncbi:MAG: toluene tolerance protein [Planctomycetota bacterium]
MQRLSAQAYDALTRGAKVLSQDRHGPKVLALADDRCVKLFRRKRLLSSATLLPYARRFEAAAARLSRLGIPTVAVDSVTRVPSIKRDAVVYRYLEGTPLREAVAQAGRDRDAVAGLLKQHAAFLAELHAKGVYFRSIHFNNVVICPDGAFGLIDISEARVARRPLPPEKRARNFRPMLSYEEDRAALEVIGVADFLAHYLRHAALAPAATARFIRKLADIDTLYEQALPMLPESVERAALR